MSLGAVDLRIQKFHCTTHNSHFSTLSPLIAANFPGNLSYCFDTYTFILESVFSTFLIMVCADEDGGQYAFLSVRSSRPDARVLFGWTSGVPCVRVFFHKLVHNISELRSRASHWDSK